MSNWWEQAPLVKQLPALTVPSSSTDVMVKSPDGKYIWDGHEWVSAEGARQLLFDGRILPRNANDDEWERLSSGMIFVGPDGINYRKRLMGWHDGSVLPESKPADMTRWMADSDPCAESSGKLFGLLSESQPAWMKETVIPAGVASLFYDECPPESCVLVLAAPWQRDDYYVLFKRLGLRGLYFRLRSDYGYGRGNLGC